MTMPAPQSPPTAPAAPGVGPARKVPAVIVPEPNGSGKPKKKSKKKLVLILVVVLLLAVGYEAKSKLLKPHYRPGQPVPAGQVVPLGTLTVNTIDGHLVQAGIDLQLTEPANKKSVAADGPQLRNAAITDLSRWSYTQLLHVSTRTVLQHQLLESFQKLLGTVDGSAQQVSGVYFTSFLLQ